ncbi:MAG: hypothetical protein J1G04_06960, partial [Clostridiales bacterium]|nr:hypothetical protein [Clostridiales bacterium]
LDTVAKMASEDMPEGEKLSKDDFLFVLQALLSDRTEQLARLTPYRYDKWYMVNGKPTYLATGGKESDRIDYETQLIEEIERAYAINFGADKNLTAVLEMLGISLDGSNEANKGSKDLLDKIDSAKFNALAEDTSDDVKLYITDRMLGAALSKQMGKLTDDSGMQDLSLTLEALTFVEKAGVDDHIYAMLAIQVDLSGLLGSLADDKESMIGKLVTGLMPESVLLTITVDVTRDRSITRDAPEYIINSCYNTDRALATLEKLVPDLNLDSIADDIGKVLTEMLDQLENSLGAEVVPASYVLNPDQNVWLGDSASIVLPDIFTVISDTVLLDDENKPVVTSNQLRNVIRDLNNPADITPKQAGGYDDFISDVFKKYYLKEPGDGEDKVTNFAQLTTYMTGFSTSKLRVTEADGLAHDKTDMSQLKPVMGDDELFSLLQDNMGGNDNISSYSIVSVTTAEDEQTRHGLLSVTLSIALDNLLSGAGKIREMISADTMYVTVTFDTEEIIGAGTDEDPHGYKSALQIDVRNREKTDNDVMEDDTKDAMFSLVRLFAKNFDIEKQVDDFGVILYKQMENLNESMGGTAEHRFITFTAAGMELTDFYTFLALKLDPTLLDDGYTNEDIRNTIQGLYELDSTENERNYRVADIIRNAPQPGSKGSRRWETDEVKDLYGSTHLDVDFNGFIKQGVERMAKDGEINVEQTIILAEGDDGDAASAVRLWLNDKLGLTDTAESIDENSDYLAITFSMSMANYVGGGESDNRLFPEKIYSTVVYKYAYDSTAEGNRFSVVGGIGAVAPTIVFNNMDATSYAIMVRLMGANPDDTGANDDDKVNIKSIAKKGAEVLNGMVEYEASIPGGGTIKLKTEITFAKVDGGEEGMGKITISKPTYNA